jgi:hypothetical protein
LDFLAGSISGFNVISAVARDKIARSLILKQFYPGTKIIKEGEISSNAFIIKEGDCILMSKKNPV